MFSVSNSILHQLCCHSLITRLLFVNILGFTTIVAAHQSSYLLRERTSGESGGQYLQVDVNYCAGVRRSDQS